MAIRAYSWTSPLSPKDSSGIFAGEAAPVE